MQRSSPRQRGGFTLVEMLVVVVIITILAAILVPAVFYAQRRARNARIATEIATMKQGFEAYKLKYGEYPPNFNDATKVMNHLNYCFPRRAADDFMNKKNSNEFVTLDPAEALVFWLRGFTSDPKYPVGKGIDAAKDNSNRTSFFEFDQSRLVDHSGSGSADFKEYEAPYCQNVPYAYFSSANYSAASYTGPSTAGKTQPYTADAGGYAEPSSFQIIAAGQDGIFSNTRSDNSQPKFGPFPSGGPVPGYSSGEYDNITSFTEGRTLEDRLP